MFSPLTPVATLSEIYIYDSVGNTALGSVDVTETANGEYLLTVVADKAFLEAESTVYPVTVDPTVEIRTSDCNIDDAMLSAVNTTKNYGADTTIALGGSNKGYIAMRFLGLFGNTLLNTLNVNQIMNAELHFTCGARSGSTLVYAAQYNPTRTSSAWWTESGITYSANGVGYVTPQYSKTITSTGKQYITITDIVKGWKTNSSLLEKGLLLRLNSNTTSNYLSIYSNDMYEASIRPYLKVEYVSDGVYRIKNQNSSKYMNVAYGWNNPYNSSASVNIYQADENDEHQAQWFRIVYSSDENAYLIYPICSQNGRGRTLSATSSSPSNGTNVASVKNASDAAKYFIIERVESNIYQILLNSDNNLAITSYGTNAGTISDTSSTSSGNIYLATDGNASNQKWILEQVDYSHEAYYANLDIEYPFRGNSVPVNISSDYGRRSNSSGANQMHKGLDLNTTGGTNLYAPFEGTIIDAGSDESMGNYVIIEADDIYVYGSSTVKLRVVYMHMQDDGRVTSGNVTTNTVVGKVGTTGSSKGNHLHISFIIDGGTSTGENFSKTIDPLLIYDEITFTSSY